MWIQEAFMLLYVFLGMVNLRYIVSLSGCVDGAQKQQRELLCGQIQLGYVSSQLRPKFCPEMEGN